MVKANPLKLGIFVTVACALFIYALLRVSDGLDFFGNTITTYVDFKDVKGLQAGNNVRFSGIGIGEVKTITIENDTTLRVQLELDAQAGNFLRKNAAVDIVTDGLVGNMIVTIHPGIGQAAFIEPGDVLISQPKTEIAGMLSELSRTNEKIAAITDNLLEISKKMNIGQGTMGLLLNDESLAMNLLNSSEGLRESSQNFRKTSQHLNQLLASVSQGEGNLGYLLQDDGLEEEVNRLSSNLDTLIRVRTEAIFKDLELTSGALRASSQKMDVLIRDLTEEEGIVSTLVKDSVAAGHLKSTLANLDLGTEKLVTNMEALKHNWFFRGYFKRQAKKEKKDSAVEKQE
ncbi:MlaD family protein [Neolewinella persica]|uniref:MlaD family protein n=1 Tax=Neolewinella persica TaxID=70998 RepID=UPI00036957FF|nr:MlaD family protein [Neolewinella persica]